MRAIFISYRREDTEGQAGRLFDDLTKHFGEDAVFMDVAGIAAGRDFRRAIEEHVASCGVLLAMIGRSWLDAKDESGRRRLEDPGDFVRLETAAALKREIPVVPVLVQGARMPRKEQLPEDLAELAFRNGVELTHARWDSDVQVLISALSPHVESGTKKSPPAGPGPARFWPKAVAGLVGAIVIAIGGYAWYQTSSQGPEVQRQVEDRKKPDATPLAQGVPETGIPPESGKPPGAVAGLADLVVGNYFGDVIADSKGGSRSNISVTITKLDQSTVRVTSDYKRLGVVDVPLTRNGNVILTAGGDTPFMVDLDRNPPTLIFDPRSELAYRGTKQK